MIRKVSGAFVLVCLAFSLILVTCFGTEDAGMLFKKNDIPSIAAYFGTKGRYEEVNTYLVSDRLYVNESLIRDSSSTCSPIHLTAIIRHGTRYPTTKNIKRMKDFYNIVQSSASNWLLNAGLSQWKMWYTEDMDGRLVEKGREDHRDLAIRLAKYFPSLMTLKNLRTGRMKFITSSKHRCVNSTISFKTGLMKHLGIEGRL